MAKTQPRGIQLLAGSVQRVDMDVTTVGNAVITKAVQGSGIVLSSTGNDAGTGDVTLNVDSNAVAFQNAAAKFTNVTASSLILSTNNIGIGYYGAGSSLEVNNGTTGIIAPVRAGSINAIMLVNPAAPSVTTVGTTGSTTWKYAITALGAGPSVAKPTTAVSATTTITNGNATLDTNNYNVITFSSVTGAVSYNIYRIAAGSSPSSIGLIGNTTSLTYSDQGAAGDSSTPPTVNTTGRLTAAGDLSCKHILGTSAAASIVVGAGAGTTPGSPSISGTDSAGTVTIITGTSTTTNAVVATITYNTPYPSGSTPILYAANAAAGNLTWEPPAAGTTTGFTISSAGTALAASTTYIWNYHIIGR